MIRDQRNAVIDAANENAICTVVFRRVWRRYGRGDVAALPRELAETAIRTGVATLVSRIFCAHRDRMNKDCGRQNASF